MVVSPSTALAIAATKAEAARHHLQQADVYRARDDQRSATRHERIAAASWGRAAGYLLAALLG